MLRARGLSPRLPHPRTARHGVRRWGNDNGARATLSERGGGTRDDTQQGGATRAATATIRPVAKTHERRGGSRRKEEAIGQSIQASPGQFLTDLSDDASALATQAPHRDVMESVALAPRTRQSVA